jgi:hypothetical protein
MIFMLAPFEESYHMESVASQKGAISGPGIESWRRAGQLGQLGRLGMGCRGVPALFDACLFDFDWRDMAYYACLSIGREMPCTVGRAKSFHSPKDGFRGAGAPLLSRKKAFIHQFF